MRQKGGAEPIIDSRYDILTSLKGQSRFILYKVRDRVSGRILALKKTKKPLTEAEKTDFMEHYKSMAVCAHEMLVPVFDMGQDAHGCHYYTMPWSDHTPLLKTRLTVPLLGHFAIQLCRALAYLHRRKHSLTDITPENILLSSRYGSMQIKLINYSFSFVREQVLELARTRSIAYLAPELIQGKHADYRIDFYALGILLFRMGTGTFPFNGTMGQILKKHLSEPPPKPGIEPHLDMIIARLLSKNPENRYSQACDILYDLQHIPSDETVWDRSRRVFGFSEGAFVNREGALTRLDAVWHRVLHSGKPAVCIIAGTEGIGRRRLLRKWIPDKTVQGVRTMYIQIPPLKDEPEAVGTFLRWLAYTSPSEPGVPPSYLTHFDSRVRISADPLKRFSGMTRNTLLLKHLACCPRLLVVGPGYDTHRRVIRFVTALLAVSVSAPVMLCIICDPNRKKDYERLFRHIKIHQEEILLDDIPRSDVLQLLQSILLQSDIPLSLIKHIDDIAGGNPLFIEATLEQLLQNDSLKRREGVWRYIESNGEAAAVPAAVRDILFKRLKNIHRGARKVLEIISVLDRPAGEDDLHGFPVSDSSRSLLEYLTEINILKKNSEPPFTYTFAHPHLKNMLYESIPQDRRKRLHASAARALERTGAEPERIAFHYLRTDRTVKMARTALTAAEWCIARGIFDRAEQWIYSAETVADRLPVKLQAQRELMHSEISLIRHRNREVLDHTRKALEMFPDTPSHRDVRSLLQLYRGQVHLRTGRFRDAERTLLEGLSFNRRNPGITSVFLLVFLGWTQTLSGRISKAKKTCLEVQHMTQQLTPNGQAEVLSGLLTSFLDHASGKRADAIACLNTVIRSADELNLNFFRVFSRNLMAEMLIHYYDFQKAEHVMTEAVSICHSTGLQMEIAVTERLKATIALRKGRLSDAEKYIQQALRINRRSESTLETARLDCLAGKLAHVQGDLAKAEETYIRLVKQFQEIEYPDGEADILTQLGFLHIDKALYTLAIRYFHQALMVRRRSGWRQGSELAFFGLGHVYWILNNRGRTIYCTRKSMELADVTHNLEVKAQTNLLLSYLARADRRFSDVEKRIGAAETLFGQAGLPWGRQAVQLVRLRQAIDHDLSDDTWNQAITVWENIRSSGIWHLQAEAALVLAKLAMRRGDHHNVHRILDPIIGKARISGYFEYLWRALRIQSNALENQELHYLSLETTDMAWKIIEQILENIKPLSGKDRYRSRPDVQAIIRRHREIASKHGVDSLDLLLPSLVEKRLVTYSKSFPNNEKSRLFRQVRLKIRSELSGARIMDMVLDVMLKLSGADRGLICLIGEDDEQNAHLSRVLGNTSPLDFELFLNSNLFSYTLNFQKPVFSSNIHIDARFCRDPLAMEIGFRSVLLVPMRVQDRSVGIVFLDSRIGNADRLGADAGIIQELANEAALSLENARLYQELDDIFIGMVKALASAVDAKDPYTRGHSVRVARYAVEIGRELGLPPQELRNLELAAFLHDIGKVGIRQHILDSPHRLRPTERELIRKHPEIGARILAPIKKFSAVRTAILQHHERFDGRGYPNRISGEDISLLARILSVADALDAMTTDRPYQKATTFDHATEQIRLHAGTQFDPDVTAALLRLHDRSGFIGEKEFQTRRDFL